MNEKSQNLAEKYRVDNFTGIKGQNLAINEIENFFRYFPNVKKALLLHGPVGIGKTSLAHVAAKEFDLEILELNASDFRNREQLEIKLKPATEQASLFKKSKILLVDEVDGLSVTDKGGLPELLELIESTQFPMIITANNIWGAKFSELRKKCRLVPLKEIDYKDIFLILQDISKKENLEIDNQILVSLAVRAKGDVRAAINDLQTIANDKGVIESYMAVDQRNKEIDIFQALRFIFKNILNEDTLKIYDQVNLSLDKIFLWLEENIPYEYSGEELYNAYEALSLADIFRGRVKRQRHWRFLVYQNILLSAGISGAKKSPKSGFTRYQKPSRILKIWMANQRDKHKKSIIAKYAVKMHFSKRKAAKEFHLMKIILKNLDIQRKLRLSEQEIKFINSLE